MKKLYNSPLLDTIAFEPNDILTLSGGAVYSGDNVRFGDFDFAGEFEDSNG